MRIIVDGLAADFLAVNRNLHDPVSFSSGPTPKVERKEAARMNDSEQQKVRYEGSSGSYVTSFKF